MPCRIGITTDPDRQQQEWVAVHPSLYNWQILGWYRTRDEAEQTERIYAASRRCEAQQADQAVDPCGPSTSSNTRRPSNAHHAPAA